MKNFNQDIDNEINNLLHINEKKKTILVLGGGGFKGISQLGALAALYDNGYLKHINTIAGTSIGALIGSILAAGYTPLELYNTLSAVDLTKIFSFDVNHLFNEYGCDNGNELIKLLTDIFIKKNITPTVTLEEFFKITSIYLMITGTCLNDKKIYYFTYKNYPNMKLFDAIRISTSVPFLFTPFKLGNKTFIDGACIDNYPIHPFRDELNKVIGIYVYDEHNVERNISTFENYFLNVVDCLMSGIHHACLSKQENQTIKIGLKNTEILTIFLNKSFDKQKLYDHGYNVACKFITQNPLIFN